MTGESRREDRSVRVQPEIIPAVGGDVAVHRLRPGDDDWAVVAAIPVDDPGLFFLCGRRSCDTRALDGGAVDAGDACFADREALNLEDDEQV